MARVVDVLVPVAVDTAYSYRVPAGLVLEPGSFVSVPLGTRHATGVVWAEREAGGDNLKQVAAVRDWPPLRRPLRDFVDWVARWTLSPRGMVLRMAVRAQETAAPPAPRSGVVATGKPPARMTDARARVLAALATMQDPQTLIRPPAAPALSLGERGAEAPPTPSPPGGGSRHSAATEGRLDGRPLARDEGAPPVPKSALAEAAGCSVGVIDGLIEDGALALVEMPQETIGGDLDPGFGNTVLNADQRPAAADLAARVASRAFSAILLEGVTGSGKTEVYFEAIAEVLRQGRQALVLMPEIALTGEFLDRFAARFGARPAEWHSGLTERRRERTLRAVASGEARAVVGARSALFLPFADLGLIVVDEEHEGAYKQEDGVIYNARDMAVVRARLERAPVVLASATPALETRVNAETGRYAWLKLPSRFGSATLPDIATVDLRREGPPRGRWLSPKAIAGIEAALGRGEQALLFLNRRGYAPLTLCRSCGHRFECPNCSAWLVEHRFRAALVCHHCGHVEPRPKLCPECREADSLTACGPGVERLAEEAALVFPDARTLTLSSDFPGGVETLRRQLEAAARGEFDLVIGTQLVAKGHNFPSLTLVVVVDADVGLANADPRAAERTFQLLRQATGRAGRAEREGHALLQTWQPEHPVIQALVSGDAERFYAQESDQRRRGGLPPFGRLAAIVVSAEDKGAAEAHARALARTAHAMPAARGFRVAPLGGLPQGEEITLLGPAEAPIAVLRKRHRFRLAAKAPRSADLQGFLRALLAAAPPPRGGVKIAIDVDPQSFL
ncbi:replication restart DNA helicase PriA [Roseiarcus fermentans]|uniref:Replication restart protein PriA n=1 Tax=Roseiarcus fermentans TaxID=1473586 RepID=A0A366FSQ7_9HYPH|nr:primosomal protein N' [Roseiarcus fermentans]RBP17561.1 replication restart DNA helicase PriA [Roseiarcus fermentans]